MLSLDIWSFLMVIGIGQGLTLCLALSLKTTNQGSNWLAFLLIVLTANLIEFLLFSSEYYVFVPHLIHITHPLVFLIGPLFYFFIKNQLSPPIRLIEIKWMHFLPFLLSIIYFIPWYVQPASYKLEVFAKFLTGENLGVGVKGFIYAFCHIAQSLTYTFLALKELKKFNMRTPTFLLSKKLGFLLVFTKVFLGYWFLQLAGLILITAFQYYVVEIDYALLLANSILIQSLSFYLIIQPNTLNYIYQPEKYSNSSLSPEDSRSILKNIELLIKEKEIYLDSELTLHKFSKELSVNKNYISQVINQQYGHGFSDYINNFRVARAKSLLTDPQKEDLKLVAVALETGFSNKTNFIRVFKKKTGKTPDEYRRSKVFPENIGHN